MTFRSIVSHILVKCRRDFLSSFIFCFTSLTIIRPWTPVLLIASKIQHRLITCLCPERPGLSGPIWGRLLRPARNSCKLSWNVIFLNHNNPVSPSARTCLPDSNLSRNDVVVSYAGASASPLALSYAVS